MRREAARFTEQHSNLLWQNSKSQLNSYCPPPAMRRSK